MLSVQSPSNAKIKEISALLKKEGRKEKGQFIVEGRKLVWEGLRSGLGIKILLYDKNKEINRDILDRAEKNGAEIIETNERVIKTLSDVKTPQGIAAVFSMPQKNLLAVANGQRGIILENLQDPGNVGTIIRTAESFGMDFVVCCNCADPYSPKVVRAAMGSLFRQNIILSGSIEEIAESFFRKGYRILGASNEPDAIGIHDITDKKNIAVAIGNEGAGLSQKCRTLCRAFVKIPISDSVESLNAAVAAAVIMWEMRGI